MERQSHGPVVAKVNAEELYEKQLEGAVRKYNQSLKEQGIEIRAFGQDQMHNLRNFMLQKLVERELLHQEALKKKIKIGPSEIDTVMEESSKQYPSREAFLNDILEEDQTVEAYRERLAYDMLVNKVTASRYEQKKKALSAREINLFYEKNRKLFAQRESARIGHILLKVPDDARDAAWEAAKKRLLKIRGMREDFRSLAKKYSGCASAKLGGDLGFYFRGQLYPALDTAAFSLKVGEISEPVESRDGIHLIKLYEHRPQGFIPPFDAIKEQVEQAAKTEQAQKIYQDYVEELMKRARIEIL